MIFHTKIDVVLSVDNLVCENTKQPPAKKDTKNNTKEFSENKCFLISYPFNPTFEQHIKLQLIKITLSFQSRRVDRPPRQKPKYLFHTTKRKKSKHGWEELQADSCQRAMWPFES